MNAIILWRETHMARQMNAINQALLYLEVIKRIPRHRFISTQEIQNSLLASGINIQTLTLQRYLKQLYESGSLPLERNDNSKPFSYRMGTDTSPFPFTNLSAQEALMLRLIEANLRYQLPGKLNKAMQPFFDAARQTLDGIQGRITHENEWLNKIAVVSNSLPQIPPNIKPRIFEAVSNALFENKKLKIVYHNAEGHEKTKNVSPLGLVQQDIRLYLVCHFDGYTDIRHLALHRINDATLLNDWAPKEKNFDIKTYVKEHHFNYSNVDTRTVLLTMEFVNEITALNLTEAPFNCTQTINKLDNGHYELNVEIEDSLLLNGWINTWKDIAGIVRIEKKPID